MPMHAVLEENFLFSSTLYNVSSVHRGGGGGVSLVHRGDIMSTSGVFSTSGGYHEYIGDTKSTSRRYHEYIGVFNRS